MKELQTAVPTSTGPAPVSGPLIPDHLFREAVEQNSLGIVITDLDGRILFANRRQLDVSGYALDELVGQPARIFRSELTPADIYRDLWQTLTAGHIWHGELTNRCRDGSLVHELIRIAPVRDPDGRISHYFQIKEPALGSSIAGLLAADTGLTDPVTGAPNRAFLLQRLAAQIGALRAGNAALTLICLELDDMAAFKESFGPAAADALLVRIAQRLTESIRLTDMLARTGPAQFALLLAEAGSSDDVVVQDMARRLLSIVATPIDLQGRTATITASIGIACCPADATTAADLLQCADDALRDAMDGGGDTFRRYLPGSAERALDWRHLSAELREALAGGKLALEFQHTVDFGSGKVVGLEALARWQHPTLGRIPPERFIPIAEESGSIIELSRWVIRATLQQLGEWQAAGLELLPVGINLSLRHFRYGDLPAFLREALADTRVPPGMIQLEISESALMRDPGYALMVVDQIRALGVSIALDEFGSSSSSLYYLSRLHIDRIKISRVFIEDITTNPVHASIVAAIIAMAHKLGKRTVAVGIETEGQALRLRHLGCDELQGYVFGRPVDADAAAAVLRGDRRLALERSALPERTLLLVDDEPDILSSLQRFLRRENYRILTAASGEQALDLMASHPVQVVMSDHRMPGMSGVELLGRVRDLYPDTARIILSGYADITTLTDAINRGAIWKYIAKPWDPALLKDQLRQAFELQPAEPAA